MASTLQTTVVRVRNLITKSVINNYLQAMSRKDIDQLLSEYTEDTTVITPDTTVKGLSQLRIFFTEMFQKFEGLNLSLLKQEIAGDIAYITWHGEADKMNIPIATGTFVIKRGKIHTQTFSAYFMPKSKVEAI